MTASWRKQLSKLADVLITVPVGPSVWPADMHEPIVNALICPLLTFSPWQVRDTELVAEFVNSVRGVWSAGAAGFAQILGRSGAGIPARKGACMESVIVKPRTTFSRCWRRKIWMTQC